MIVKTLLIFLLTIFGYSEYFFGTPYIQRPIILGTLTGLILGDVQSGIIMGATLELAMLGAISVGAYNPPDLVSGTILGVSLAIQSGGGPETALTLGIPVATLMIAANTAFCQPLLLMLIHRCDKHAENLNIGMFNLDMFLAGYVQQLFGIICVPLAFYFGTNAVSAVLGHIPEFVQTGMNIAAGLLPALGFAMLVQMMINKKVAPFFFIGFFIVAFSSITTTGVAILAILMVVIFVFYGLIKGGNNVAPAATENSSFDGGNFDEF
jgi:fructoselysine and glucoselysine-specific PTS system IIC component